MSKEIWGIILASGMSKRMGHPKMLLKYKNKTMVEHVIESARNSNLDGIAIVINQHVAGLYKHVKSTRVDKVIKNDTPQKGLSASIKKGIKHLPKEAEAVIILLADQPEMTNFEINSVIKTYRTHNRPLLVQCSYRKGEKGHPILFHNKLFQHLFKIEGDQGGKTVIKQFKDEIVYAKIDRTNFPDIDNYDDYVRLIMKEEAD